MNSFIAFALVMSVMAALSGAAPHFKDANQAVVRRIVNTDKAPKPIGPYSQAVQIDSVLYVSGTIGIDPATGALVEGGVVNQTVQALDNIAAVLAAAETSFDHVFRTTIMLADIRDFAAVNAVYEKYFLGKYPARAVYQAAALVKAARVEIEAYVVVGEIIDV